MKKPPTDLITIQGPPEKRGQLEKAINRLGFSIVKAAGDEPALPWREALGVAPADEPGVSLRGARGKEGLTQAQLAAMSGIPQRHISEMENNKRPIGKETAKRLAIALNVDYRVFL
jgi:hypothetical protein